MLNEKAYRSYCDILKQELLLAMGCTEPIAIAYSAAIVKKELGVQPQKMKVSLSGNIIKNVKSVVVPGTGGAKGIEAAIAAGVIAGCPEKKLEVLCDLGDDARQEIDLFLQKCQIEICTAENGRIFDIQVEALAGENTACVRIVDFHTNVVLLEKNRQKIIEKELQEIGTALEEDKTFLNVKDIIEFANTVKLEDIQKPIEQQIAYNSRIAEEGLKNPYGACIGQMLFKGSENDVCRRARAFAAAGSDARMNGCELPVCIVSGSGNQGITASVPVIVYAEELKVSHEKLLRALVISNLVTIHQKTGIGRLSAYCGVITAGSGCGAGIAYLHGGGYEEIAHTIVNSVAILSGTICDGAKSSCAAKISMAVEAGILGFEMYRSGQQFYDGEGIVTKGVEKTIKNVGRLAKQGMSETDSVIMKIMLGK
ncbi:L-cysteine desulfidase family protein [Scatolibacter rhodanostii]|uniref:L-cysteine desulfidase family protein n=1 Tax=Scatolibacter rhodanostii TaxID=2014781 RepID=UPI000C0899A6|nr:L-serine ammonia-lyase, iron-sulfur-dependent, subunit alpha [Scatolibacter rhodanostii]